MPVVLAVALGGALGASARYGADRLIDPPVAFPWSTFAVNIVGCFFIGLASQELGDAPDWIRNGVVVGLIGGFTTFSTFAYQALENHAALSTIYVALSVGLGVAAVALGRTI
jgi:fluoride exporter